MYIRGIKSSIDLKNQLKTDKAKLSSDEKITFHKDYIAFEDRCDQH